MCAYLVASKITATSHFFIVCHYHYMAIYLMDYEVTQG